MKEFLDNYKLPNPTLRKHFLVFFIVLFFGILFYLNTVHAEESKTTYPKIANYFLHFSIKDEQVKDLAKWDILILDAENQINNPEKIKEIKKINPKIIILAYIQAQELSYDKETKQFTTLRQEIKNSIFEDWYLHDKDGNRLSLWPGATLINITAYEKWSTTLPNFIKSKILSSKLWDGIFLDNLSSNISWFNYGNIDINNDGNAEIPNEIDTLWKQSTMNILSKIKNPTDEFIIIGNSASDLDLAKYLNGRMFETFPTPWEGKGKWEDSMNLYLKKFPEKNIDPKIYIINSNTNNSGQSDDWKKMRFGLTSTLLGDGYYSFDFGDKNHGQLYWYDEYESYLGESKSNAYNILDTENKEIKPGLWRRDFQNGIVLVNSTDKKQRYFFQYEIFEKLRGTQDKEINNGNKINYIELDPADGIILLKTINEIYDSAYKNGNFSKVYNSSGVEKKSPFFHYESSIKSNSIIIHSDIDGDDKKELISTYNGLLTVYKKNQKQMEFYPYTKNFNKEINIAVGDVNNDGINEIITGAGLGGGPHIRIFDKNGNIISQFFAYDKNFRGGVSVAVGDVNNDGINEIITGAMQDGNTEIKTFNNNLKQINNFSAYTTNKKIRISSSDVDNDGESEILVSTMDF